MLPVLWQSNLLPVLWQNMLPVLWQSNLLPVLWQNLLPVLWQNLLPVLWQNMLPVLWQNMLPVLWQNNLLQVLFVDCTPSYESCHLWQINMLQVLLVNCTARSMISRFTLAVQNKLWFSTRGQTAVAFNLFKFRLCSTKGEHCMWTQHIFCESLPLILIMIGNLQSAFRHSKCFYNLLKEKPVMCKYPPSMVYINKQQKQNTNIFIQNMAKHTWSHTHKTD